MSIISEMYEEGQKDAAEDILKYIKNICFSREDNIIKFRIDYGSHGVKDNIINYIQKKYNL